MTIWRRGVLPGATATAVMDLVTSTQTVFNPTVALTAAGDPPMFALRALPDMTRRRRFITSGASRRVNRSHPLAAGLKFATFGDMRQDIVGGLPSTIVGTPTRGVTQFGEGMAVTGGAGVTYPVPLILSANSTVASIMIAVKAASFPADYATLFDKAASGVDREMGLFFNTGGTTNYFGWGHAGADPGVNGFALTAGATYVIVISGVAQSTTQAYRDVSRFNQTPSTGSFPTQAVLKLGHSSGGGTSWEGTYSACAIWNRLLSNNEANALYTDPFCFLRL